MGRLDRERGTLSDPNPYADDPYAWGPPQQPGAPEYGRPGGPVAGYGYPQAPNGYGYPQGAQPGYGYPRGAAPGFGAPQQFGVAPAGGVPMLSLGDITVMNDQIVTPSGTMPLKGAVWTATDLSRTEERIPTAGVVLAVIFFMVCLLGLLFLLMKEKKTTGFIQVSVTSGGRHHATMLPAYGPDSFAMVMAQLNTARAMSV